MKMFGNGTELQQEDFVKALLENSPDGIVVCDAHGTLRYFNAATRKFHGLPEAAVAAGGMGRVIQPVSGRWDHANAEGSSTVVPRAGRGAW